MFPDLGIELSTFCSPVARASDWATKAGYLQKCSYIQRIKFGMYGYVKVGKAKHNSGKRHAMF